ncbi:MAG: EAL domain-containing protein [Solirubrobacteraceae bacterium]
MAESTRALKQAKLLLRVQQAIAGHIAGALSRAELLEHVLATLGESLEWSWGAAWARDADECLRCRATWQRQGSELADFSAETMALAYARGEGLPGRTWAAGEPVWVPDMARDQTVPRRDVAQRAGLVAAVSFPVAVGERFHGTLEFWSAAIREPDADLLAMFAAVGSHLAQFLERWAAVERLADSEELNRSVVAALEEGVLVSDAEGRIISANASAGRILGLPSDALFGHSTRDLGAARAGPIARVLRDDGGLDPLEISLALQTLETGVPQRDVILRISRGDGDETWVSVNVQPLQRPGEDQPHGVVASLADITAWRAAERSLREERDLAQRYLEVTSTMIIVLDEKGCIVLINPKGCEVLGRRPEELIGKGWFEAAVPERERARVRAAFHRLVAGDVEALEFYEYPVWTAEDEERTIAWHNGVLRDESGRITGTVSSGEDVTERRAAERQITYLAYHDRLTGLPNRTLLEEHLALAVPRASRQENSLALLFLDLDNFKLVNDSFGHTAGDELLREVAGRLREVTRASDLLARQGGDEFLLLLTDLGDHPPATAAAVAGKLVAAFAEPFELGGSEFQVNASIGVSIYPRDATDGESLLRHADAAMYQAKGAGRGRISVYASDDPDLQTLSMLERLSAPTQLRRAIERDELVMHYQPVVRLADDQVVGMEALVRWQHPERGLLLPAHFIPLAEETGLISALGDWVLAAVLAQTAAWTQEGLAPQVSFNLSPHQLRQPSLPDRVREQLVSSGVDASSVSAEITESAAMVELAATAPVLGDLAALGIRLAVDDFGAGYSSLARLRTLPVHILKIDRSFLAEIPESREARAIVSSIVRLAGALGKVAIAEGVETPEQRAFLIEHGCPLAQGFLLARPMPAEQASDVLLEARRATV